MTWTLDINETMSGWLAFDSGDRHSLRLQLTASAPLLSSPTGARPFTGTVSLDEAKENVPAEGTLTLLPRGPIYDFSFNSPKWGRLRCVGHKHYRLRGLKDSLVTCPLHLYQGETCIGAGEIKYREPLWHFALKSLRLRRAAAGATAVAGAKRG